MDKKGKSQEELEIEKLRAELAETRETLRAIQSGEVDALIISGAQGDQVFTLKSAELPYRILIEQMKEGAATLAEDDTILYCNSGFAGMLKMPLEKMMGTGISQFISSSDQPIFEELLQKGRLEYSEGEISFLAGDGTLVPVHLSLNKLQMDGISAVYLVVTDLTEHRRSEERIQEQASLLDNAQEAIGVRSLEHNLIYWNKGAERLYGWTAGEATGKKNRA